MAKERKCGICGGTGHDARNCPAREASDPRDKIVWYKVSNLTDRQADDMTSAFVKAKRRIAPDAEAAFAKGDKKTLPERIARALGFGKGEE